jgi:hypothetical protein
MMTIRGGFSETVIGAPPEGWTLGHVTLTLLNPEERVPVEAWRRGAFAVHEAEGGGRLTHAPTGLRIWTCDTMDTAAELAQRIEGLADWESIKKMLPPKTELYPRVRSIIDEIETRDVA